MCPFSWAYWLSCAVTVDCQRPGVWSLEILNVLRIEKNEETGGDECEFHVSHDHTIYQEYTVYGTVRRD